MVSRRVFLISLVSAPMARVAGVEGAAEAKTKRIARACERICQATEPGCWGECEVLAGEASWVALLTAEERRPAAVKP